MGVNASFDLSLGYSVLSFSFLNRKFALVNSKASHGLQVYMFIRPWSLIIASLVLLGY